MRDRDPLLVCLLGIIAVSTVRSALGHLPPSLARAPHMGQFAAISLGLGCLVVVLGILWKDREDGWYIEQVGLAFAAFGSLFYALALSVPIAWDRFTNAAIPTGMTLGLGVGAIVKYFLIQRRIRRRKHGPQ